MLHSRTAQGSFWVLPTDEGEVMPRVQEVSSIYSEVTLEAGQVA